MNISYDLIQEYTSDHFILRLSNSGNANLILKNEFVGTKKSKDALNEIKKRYIGRLASDRSIRSILSECEHIARELEESGDIYESQLQNNRIKETE